VNSVDSYYAPRPTVGGGGVSDAAIHPSVSPMPLAQKRCIVGQCYYRTLVGSLMLEVESTKRKS